MAAGRAVAEESHVLTTAPCGLSLPPLACLPAPHACIPHASPLPKVPIAPAARSLPVPVPPSIFTPPAGSLSPHLQLPLTFPSQLWLHLGALLHPKAESTEHKLSSPALQQLLWWQQLCCKGEVTGGNWGRKRRAGGVVGREKKHGEQVVGVRGRRVAAALGICTHT